jgi:SAM-dependent methyltransferase
MIGGGWGFVFFMSGACARAAISFDESNASQKKQLAIEVEMAVHPPYRSHTPDPRAISQCIARACRDPHVLDYMSKMWEQVLEATIRPTGEAWHDRWGELQLPYVPVQPERLGLALFEHSRFLDVGCLAGYGLYDFVRRRRAESLPIPRLTGVDKLPVACEAGRSLARHWRDDGIDVRFVMADLENLPFADQTFDLVVARCVLAYVDLEIGLRELHRVLKPSGLAIIQVHGPRYYGLRLATSWRSPRRMVYYARPLVRSARLACRGRPPRGARFRETALTGERLIRLCRRQGMAPVWSRKTPYRPLVVLRA